MGSENGWEPPRLDPNSDLLVWKTVPGTDPPVNIQVMRGFPEVMLIAFVADFNAYIAQVHDGDTASYTPTNAVATSNHLNATAVDVDWDDHPFHVKGTFNADQMAVIRELVGDPSKGTTGFYEGWIWWAGDWDDPIDEMHWQMGYNTWNHNPAGFDFINRKIRPDGFSTFRREPAPAPQPLPAPQPPSTPDPRANAIQVLYEAVESFGMDDAAANVNQVMQGLALSGCTNPKRVAMWLAQIGEESGSFVYTEEIDKSGPYAPFIGRTWIQITWQTNYQQFGQWCKDQGLVDDPNTFVNNPPSLADKQWAGIGPAWYWTVARPQINDLCDQADMNGVTRAINGGLNGLADRQARYDHAIALGDRLMGLVLPAPTPPAPAGPPPATAPQSFEDWKKGATDRELLEYVVDQLGPGDPSWSSTGSTLRDELWNLATPAVKTAAKKRAAPAKKTTTKASKT